MLDDPALQRVPGDSQELGGRNDAAGGIQRGDAESPLCGGEVVGVQDDGERAHARTDCWWGPPILVMAVRLLAFLAPRDSCFVGEGLRRGQMPTVVSDTAPCEHAPAGPCRAEVPMSRRRRRLQLIRQAGGFSTAHDADLPVPAKHRRGGWGRDDIGCGCDPAVALGEASPAGGAPSTSDRRSGSSNPIETGGAKT